MNRIPKLTARQRAFLEKLVELYREHHEPVHYSAVAERLGVNRFSAYDMLKVLEKKGFASSSYALAAGHSGPGRSIVVFAPTAVAEEQTLDTIPEQPVDDEWESVRVRVLNRLHEARDANYREALNDLLARLPETQTPLTFCTNMVGALLLNMRRARTRARGLSPFRALQAFRTGSSAELETLAGLSVGATLMEQDETETSITHRLLEHARHYQTNLSKLSEDGREALLQFLEEALEALD
jgi:fluoride ion exporter CrcB/FEX